MAGNKKMYNSTKLFSVEGKIAVITGGSRGLGAMIARGLAENGARVYITSRSVEMCQATAEEISQYGDCKALPADISSIEGRNSLVRQFSDQEEKLDILVNNAGTSWHDSIDNYSENAWDSVVDINLKSPFFLVQKLMTQLQRAASEANPSRVINVASIAGMKSSGSDNFAYSASKAGIIQLTRHLANRLAKDNITVNSLSPGLFKSQLTASITAEEWGEITRTCIPRGRIGSAEDIIGAVNYLCSRAGAWLTGINIPVDGGLLVQS